MNNGLPSASASDDVRPPGLVMNQICHAHQFVHVRRKTQDARGMLAILRGEFAPQLFVPAANNHGLKLAAPPCPVPSEFSDRPHAETATQHQQHRQIIAQAE